MGNRRTVAEGERVAAGGRQLAGAVGAWWRATVQLRPSQPGSGQAHPQPSGIILIGIRRRVGFQPMRPKQQWETMHLWAEGLKNKSLPGFTNGLHFMGDRVTHRFPMGSSLAAIASFDMMRWLCSLPRNRFIQNSIVIKKIKIGPNRG